MIVALLQDGVATYQRERKIQLLDRLAAMGTLSAGMAHEIKNALVPIKTFVDLLLKQNQENELALVVDREIRRINSTVTQVLRFAGSAKPSFATVRIHEPLEHALRLLKHLTRTHKITLECDWKALPDTIHGDEYQLEQAFVNLLLNAIESTGQQGRIRVSTAIVPAEPALEGRPPQLVVRFCNTGPNIPEEHLEKLFEPFFTTKATGTGLGLPITRRIVDEHGGVLRVQSRRDEATTFELLFPLPRSEQG